MPITQLASRVRAPSLSERSRARTLRSACSIPANSMPRSTRPPSCRARRLHFLEVHEAVGFLVEHPADDDHDDRNDAQEEHEPPSQMAEQEIHPGRQEHAERPAALNQRIEKPAVAGGDLLVHDRDRDRELRHGKAGGQHPHELAKTDRLDAEVIALFAERVRPEARAIPNAQVRALADLVARRRQIIDMITAGSNRQRKTHDRRLQSSLERHLAWLQHELSGIDRDLEGTVRGTPAWRETGGLLA